MVDWSPAARGNSANFSWWCATYQLQKHHGRIRCVIVVQQCISTDSWNILHMCQKLPQQDDIVRHGHFGDRFPLGSIPLSQGMVISNWFINAIVATSIKFESAFPAIKYLKNGSWVVWIVWFDITRTPFVFFPPCSIIAKVVLHRAIVRRDSSVRTRQLQKVWKIDRTVTWCLHASCCEKKTMIFMYSAG